MAPIPNVLFVGGTPRGKDVFEFLLSLHGKQHNICSVICMAEDDHEQFNASTEIIKLAEDNNISVSKKKRIDADDLANVANISPDLILCVGWRTIIPSEFFSVPRLGCLGVHDSLLPKYRGFAPMNWAIINGEKKWGVTLFHLSNGVDEGDIVGQISFLIPERGTAPQLYELTRKHTVDVIANNWNLLLENKAPKTKQNHAEATFACSRNPEDGRIDWAKSTDEIDRLIRGLMPPYPGAFTMDGEQKIIIARAEPADEIKYDGRIPGRVVAIKSNGVEVLTGTGVIRLIEVVIENENKTASEVLRSVRTTLS